MTAPRDGPVRALVPLLAAAIFINYIDRGNLATASPLMAGELHLTNTQLGLLTSAFYWVYAPSQLFAAALVERLSAYRALALGVALWSLATVLTGFAGSFVLLLVLRVLLAVGESAGFPASSKLLAQYLPQHRLGSANALVSAGISLGPAVGTWLGGLLVARTGWRMLFVIFGALSLLWLLPWRRVTRATLADSTRLPANKGTLAPGYRQILSRREFWGAALGHFGNNYSGYLVLSWLPIYLVRTRGYSMSEMAQLGGLTYALTAGLGLVMGSVADRLMARGAGANAVRKGMICPGICAGLIGMLMLARGTSHPVLAMLLGYSIFHGLSSFNIFAIGQTLAGPAAAARWMALQNGIANVGGMVAPALTGIIVDRTRSFDSAFLLAAGVLVVGLLSWGVLIRRVEPLRWTATP